MGRRAGRGALIGLTVGAALVFGLIWLPAAMRGDFYEITDPLVYMGGPMIVVCTAIGTVIGALLGAARPEVAGTGVGGGTGPDGIPARPSTGPRWLVIGVAAAAAVLAIWFFLWAGGVV